jgi:hypothetical protein
MSERQRYTVEQRKQRFGEVIINGETIMDFQIVEIYQINLQSKQQMLEVVQPQNILALLLYIVILIGQQQEIIICGEMKLIIHLQDNDLVQMDIMYRQH